MPRTAAEGLSEGETRLDKLGEDYLQRGLRRHPRKTFRKVSKTECRGALIDGETGLVRASPMRLIPFACFSHCFAAPFANHLRAMDFDFASAQEDVLPPRSFVPSTAGTRPRICDCM